jgi:hypothetical protein
MAIYERSLLSARAFRPRTRVSVSADTTVGNGALVHADNLQGLPRDDQGADAVPADIAPRPGPGSFLVRSKIGSTDIILPLTPICQFTDWHGL